MKEYIKKFESLNAADNHVIDNPFTSYIVGQGNLVCNEENKKLKLEGGSIVIANAVEPPTIVDLATFYLSETNKTLFKSPNFLITDKPLNYIISYD